VELIPALDLIGGTVVRLHQGDYGAVTTYGDPVALAEGIAQAGATRLHVVDLDAAKSGDPVNTPVIEAIARAIDIPVQCGGGVRSMADVERLLGAGVDRMILGTVALEQPDLARAMAASAPGHVVLGLDYRAGDDGQLYPAGRGWLTSGPSTLFDVLDDLADAPFAALVSTAIVRDGTLAGPDLEGLAALLERSAFPVVASGGVASLADLEVLAGLAAGGRTLAGAICGKAILEGRFSVAEGVATCAAFG
jgi:phosphoribosylformimino-5-aminoimidazole carboxamide ribotide isomerase